MIHSFAPKGLAEDFEQEVYLLLLEMPADRIVELERSGFLIGYFIKLIKNVGADRRVFNKNYFDKDVTDYFIASPAEVLASGFPYTDIVGYMYEDVVNAKATYELIQGFGKEVIFCLSRSRHPHNSPRLKFQFRNFFQTFENPTYFVLEDSDVIDLSRTFKKSVYELANDKSEIENINSKLLQAFDKKNNNEIYQYSQILEILEDAKKYKETNIDVAYQVLDQVLNGK